MGKLLQRLSDVKRSGVYRVARPQEVLDATKESRLQVLPISLAGVRDKAGLLATLGRALRFPAWFGANWDALEDCLTDLSWIDAAGYVLLIEQSADLAQDDVSVFTDILASAARHWAARGMPFFAVFVAGPPNLPPLFREEAHRR
ncbi:MAG TPA: barstar family protein [Burkholderiales bacterium]|nr:barstar family protein [Burkholderiales bacterium]